MSNRRHRAGMSLIEVVVFIVVLGIGLAGILTLYNRLTIASVDPIVRKQALAIASSLLEEIELRAFTYCDPDDPAVFTATSTAGCDPLKIETMVAETFSPPGTETRFSTTAPFDNVNDYNSLPAMSGSNTLDPNSIRDIADNTIAGLGGYTVTVSVVQIAANELGAAVTNTTDALRITVTVTGPTNVIVSLRGYRLRYAPNSP
jgi:MSHA pilin protein MshD